MFTKIAGLFCECAQLFFLFPELPPGRSRVIVMLPVVAKEIAAQKGQEVVFLLAAGFMTVAGFMGSPVGQVGAEIEELQRGQQGRDNPEKNYIFLRKEEFEQVVRNCHGNNLPPYDILF